VGLLGLDLQWEQDFFIKVGLVEKFGHRGYRCQNKGDQTIVQHIYLIMKTLQGIILPQSKASYLNINREAFGQAFQAVIFRVQQKLLLLVKAKTTLKFLYDTTDNPGTACVYIGVNLEFGRHHF